MLIISEKHSGDLFFVTPSTFFGCSDVKRFYKSCSGNHLLFSTYLPGKAFINSTPKNNKTVQVRSGESLLLSVDLEAYPKPHMLSWSFMGHELKNTSDHVITTHRHEYR